jgi:hypothetical protein
VLWVAMVKFQDGEIANAAIHTLGSPQILAQPRTVSDLGELVVGCRTRFVGRRIALVVHL